MAKANKSALDRLLDDITPLEQEITDAKMMIAARIADAIEAKNWKNKDLLKAVGKDNPSVITKWLSGTHNFTTETLVEISKALGISLLNLEEKRSEIEIVYYPLYIKSGDHASGTQPFKPKYNELVESEEVHLLNDFGMKYNNTRT
ncbi:MAG TPA: helix-turn-helix transcriptional regulator [Saprospiraceae bacterium]|nr:helix-turn-helix transcriptional regulator [Saprospiraceae bacterium]